MSDELILRAAAFAAVAHSTQRRKDVAATPYINHPLAVASLLATLGQVRDPELLAAALLHDVLEDCPISAQDLAEAFGARVSALVQEVSDDPALSRTERKRMQIVHAALVSTDAQLIKLADKICNLRDIVPNPPKDWDLKRCQDYFDWAKEVVEPIRNVSAPLAEAFDAVFAERPTVRGRLAPALPEALQRAYEGAEYRVSNYPHDFVFHIGALSRPITALLWDYSLASAIFITADNPHSQKRSAAENEAARVRLRQRLEDLKAVAILAGAGVDPTGVWPEEAGFLALGLSKEAGLLLAKEFKQNAFILCVADRAPELVVL